MFRVLGVAACLCALGCGAGPGAAEAEQAQRGVEIGQPAPEWKPLEGVDGKSHGLADYREARVLVVAFTCNHCPIAQAYQQRWIDFVKEMRPKGVELVAISVSNQPEDRLDKMKERAKEVGYNFDYLYDPRQETGHAFGAITTPHVFVLDADRKVAYAGAYDDSIDPANVKRPYVRDAVTALLEGKDITVRTTKPFGCGIDYSVFVPAAPAQKPAIREAAVPMHTTDSLDTVRKNLEQGKAVLVDVREQAEWDAGRLVDARLVPLSRLREVTESPAAAAEIKKLLPDDKVLYLHCRSGGRVLPACSILTELGYEVRPLKAGYEDLLKAGFSGPSTETPSNP